MTAPKPKAKPGKRLWEPLDRPGVFLSEAEVEAEEDAHDIAVMEDYDRREAAGEVDGVTLEEAIEQGLISEDPARLLR